MHLHLPRSAKGMIMLNLSHAHSELDNLQGIVEASAVFFTELLGAWLRQMQSRELKIMGQALGSDREHCWLGFS